MPGRKHLPVYDYEELCRQGVVPLPVDELPPLPDFPVRKSVSEQLREMFPPEPEVKPSHELSAPKIPAEPEDMLKVDPVLIFRYEPKLKQLVSLLKLQNQGPGSFLFRISSTCPDRFKINPSMGCVLPLATSAIDVIVEHSQYEPSLESFYQEKIFVETIFSSVAVPRKAAQISIFKKKGTKIKTIVMEQFMLYRPPPNFLFTEERVALDMIQTYDGLKTEAEHRQQVIQEELELDALETQENDEAQLAIMAAGKELLEQIPPSPVRFGLMNILLGLTGVSLCAIYAVCMYLPKK